MDIFPVDLHLLLQALLYFAAVLCGFIAALPTIFAKHNFKNQCILYAEVTWDESKATIHGESHTTGCDFVIGTFVTVCILYSFFIGCYYAYAVRKSVRDKEIARQMWAMPFLLLNALGTFFVFSAACVTSIGFHTFCNGIMSGEEHGSTIKSCSADVNIDNINGDISLRQFFRYFTVAEIAGWTAVLILVLQTAFTVLRMVRNRRQRSQETFQGVTTADTDKMASIA